MPATVQALSVQCCQGGIKIQAGTHLTSSEKARPTKIRAFKFSTHFEFEQLLAKCSNVSPWLVFSLTYLYLPVSALCSLPTANSIRLRLLCSNSRMTSWKLLTLEKSQFCLLSTCPLHSILLTMPHFSTDFSILSVCPAMSSYGFDPT